MTDANKIMHERQRAIRREMDRRGISIKAVQLDGGWDTPSTVLSYFPADEHKEPAVMSVASQYRLYNALPPDLLSLLLPDGYAVVRVPEGVDIEELAEKCQELLIEKGKAHHPESEDGAAISEGERERILDKVVRLPLGKVA